jgi:hypothetical protein
VLINSRKKRYKLYGYAIDGDGECAILALATPIVISVSTKSNPPAEFCGMRTRKPS